MEQKNALIPEVSIVSSYILYVLVQEGYRKRPIYPNKLGQGLARFLGHEIMTTSGRIPRRTIQ